MVLEQFEKDLSTAKRNNLPIALMFIDLDGFKKVNDTLGHAYGDDILKNVGEIISTSVRNNDLCGRLGGDEFIIVLLGIHDLQDLQTITEKVLAKIDKLATDETKEFGASIGIVHGIAKQHDSVKSLLRSADKLMYQVKQQGKDNYLIAKLKD